MDFGRVVTITGIATQGNPIADDWVKEFYLDYGITVGSLTHYQEDGTTKVCHCYIMVKGLFGSFILDIILPDFKYGLHCFRESFLIHSWLRLDYGGYS